MAAGTFSLGFNDGGPIMVWSNWVLTAVMNLAVALSLAEIASAMPVAGGPYHWCALCLMSAAVSRHAGVLKRMRAQPLSLPCAESACRGHYAWA